MRNDIALKQFIGRINIITNLDMIVLYPSLFEGSTIVDFDLLYPYTSEACERRQQFTAHLNKDGNTLNKRSIRRIN